MSGPGGHIVERVGADGTKRHLVKVELEADPATGRRRQVSGGTYKTKREAQERLAALITLGRKAPVQTSLAEFLRDEWFPSKADLAPATRAQYEWAMERIVSRLGAVKLGALKARHVQELYAALRHDGLSPRSRQIVGKSLRNALAVAVRRDYLARNPADGVPVPNGDRLKEVEFWSATEAREFLAAGPVRANRLLPLWFVALSTGLRRGELAALRWRDVDLPGSKLTVRQAVQLDGYCVRVGPPKTKASIRTIGLDERAVDVLVRWHDDQQVELSAVGVSPSVVFSEPDGSIMHPQTMASRFTAIIRKAGARQIGLHGLRHTHATLALEAGVPLKIVSERLGHSSVQITADIYQHALEHMQHDAAQAIGALLAGEKR